MKHCPKCLKTYDDQSLVFCTKDGEPLVRNDKTANTVAFPAEPSIAVLPFNNFRDDPEIDYLCKGLAGELINNLAKIVSLKVAARVSTFDLRSKGAGITEIGQALNVNFVLEGSIAKADERLRIAVELISVSTSHCLWSDTYDCHIKDILEIQDQLTLAIVGALKLRLLGEEKTEAIKRHTSNVEAYKLYLKARIYFDKHTEEAWQKAIECFEKAIAIDEEYAPAYAGLSSVLAFVWFFGSLPPDEAIPKWKMANSRALEIGDELEETHIAVGRYRFLYEWNWNETEREYQRALELNPHNADAHQQYGLFLASKGRFEEAIVKGRTAVELDPRSLVVNLHLGWIYWLASRSDDVFDQVQQMLEIDSSFYAAYWQMGTTHILTKNYEAAVDAYQKALELGGSCQVLAALGHVYGLLGKRSEALGVIDKLLEGRKHRHTSAYNLALVYGGLRENDEAFQWLETAYQERNGELVYVQRHAEVGVEGLWGNDFRADARFADLLHRVGFE